MSYTPFAELMNDCRQRVDVVGNISAARPKTARGRGITKRPQVRDCFMKPYFILTNFTPKIIIELVLQ